MEHRDRLTRFGVEHLAGSISPCGQRIVLLEDSETISDFLGEVTEVLTSLCAGLYQQYSTSYTAAKTVAARTGDQSG
jgi:putative resolvase